MKTDGTYVTWMDSLHPETDDVTVVDEDSPLWSVYEGARNDLPVATAVPTFGGTQHQQPPVPAAREEGTAAQPSALVVRPSEADAAGGKEPNTVAVDIEVPSDEPTNDHNNNNNKTGSSDTSSGLDLLVGCLLSFTTIMSVFFIELIAWSLYMMSVGFYTVAQSLDPPNVITGLFYSIFFLVYWIMALVDSILLLISVFVAELMAAVNYSFSCLLGNCNVGLRWHQYIRKTCHRTRWAFRCRLAYEVPPRQFCGFGRKDEEVEFVAEDKEEEEKQVGRQYRLKNESTTTVPTSAPFQDEGDLVVVAKNY